ncbi:MAG: YlmC/YmxH family sporulation protein [Ruminococcaceae bacterium]|nr:YlmC/YmxH family sporulation protein [Oscillospiraceae bacterium]
MKTTTFSNLSCKEVVNCRDGRSIGFVDDLTIDTENGTILSLLIKEQGKFFCFSKSKTIEIAYENIQKIGKDIILVDMQYFPEISENHEKKEKKKFGFFH